MGFKKGEPRPANAGRKPGSPNKLTTETREVFRLMFDRLAPKAERWIEQAAKKDPGRGADLTLRMAEFHIPKQPREIEVSGKGGGSLVIEIVKFGEAHAEHAHDAQRNVAADRAAAADDHAAHGAATGAGSSAEDKAQRDAGRNLRAEEGEDRGDG